MDKNVYLSSLFYLFSDTMDNLGAFITLNGKDMKPNFITYPAVVRFLAMSIFFLSFKYIRFSVALTLWGGGLGFILVSKSST